MPPKQTVPLSNFEAALAGAERVFVQDRLLIVNDKRERVPVMADDDPNQPHYRPLTASKIVGLAFLSLIAAWEEYLEETFVRYMAGAKSPCGWAPELRVGPCATLSHARQVLYASHNLKDNAKGRWNHGDWVRGMAGIYFKDGAPYSQVPRRSWRHIESARFVRNRVAHSSDRAKAQFKRAANELMGKDAAAALPNGFSPGLLLVSEAPINFLEKGWARHASCRWGDFFEGYLCLFHYAAATITPGPSPAEPEETA